MASTSNETEKENVVTKISPKEHKDYIKSEKKIAIQYSASWCGGCKLIAPTFERLAQENPDVKFFKMFADDDEDFMEEIGIAGFPSFRVYQNNNILMECLSSKEEKVVKEINAALHGATESS